MNAYKKTRVVSVRLEADLLDAVRKAASRDGRSVSGEIAYFVSDRLGRQEEETSPRVGRITGWLSGRDAPSTHAEFKELRRAASKRLRASVRTKTKAT